MRFQLFALLMAMVCSTIAAHDHSHEHDHHDHGHVEEREHGHAHAQGKDHHHTAEISAGKDAPGGGHDHAHAAHDHTGHDHNHGHSHHHKRKGPRIEGNTLLMGAILHSETDKAIELINDPNINISATNKDGVSALMYCFGKREYKVAELLLERGANVFNQNKDGVSALLLAVTTVKDEKLRVKLVSMLVERGADLVALSESNSKAKQYLDAQEASSTTTVKDSDERVEL